MIIFSSPKYELENHQILANESDDDIDVQVATV